MASLTSFKNDDRPTERVARDNVDTAGPATDGQRDGRTDALGAPQAIFSRIFGKICCNVSNLRAFGGP